MLLFSLAILFGLLFLVLSADRFVSSSVALAKDFGISPFLIGMTIIAFGTSAPEMIVSATAAFSGSSDLAVGNAIGSNIANIGLVLGITTLLATIPIHENMVKKEFPLLTLVTIIGGSLFLDDSLSRIDGLILISLLCFSLYVITRDSSETQNLLDEVDETPPAPITKATLLLLASLVTLLISAKLLVWGASGVARFFVVSELIIGLTIVSIGTRLPELAASVASAMKGHLDMALGNIIGSNLFNLLAVLPLPALIAPPTLDPSVLYRDYTVMLAFTVALMVISIIIRRTPKFKGFGKLTGLTLLSGYFGYLYFLFISTV